jgi:hypothetical protein
MTIILTLTLFVPRIGANDQQPTLAADQLAVFANTLHAGADFHGQPLVGGRHPEKTSETPIVLTSADPTRGRLL